MTQDIVPKGYLSIHEAVRILADVPIYSADDNEWLDIGDHLNDASAIDAATRYLRQRVCDGELPAYYQSKTDRIIRVPKWTWADDKACLDQTRIRDVQFREFQFFHSDGIEISGVRSRVYLSKKEFDAFRKSKRGETDTETKKIEQRPGRPKGVGAFNDERWLQEMDKLIKEGIGPMTAANSVERGHFDEIERKKGARDESVAQRLYRKWKALPRLPSSE